MGLSYRTRFLLELTLVVVTVMSNIIPYVLPNSILVLVFTIPSALIAILFLIDSSGTRRAEGADFRKRIIDEAQTILGRLAWDQNYYDIPYPYWSGKMEGLKVEGLGSEDYRLWKDFYDSIEARNEFFRSTESFAWGDLQRLNRSCFDSFAKVLDSVSWVKELVPQTYVAELLTKARQHVNL
jgi:hypothetical protein